MRRNVGVGRAMRAQQERQAFQEKGAALTEANMAHMQEQLAIFRRNLEVFAEKHKRQINRDPEFRDKFQRMCAKIGVDPLASNKGFWAELLGVGSFFFELGVQVIHVCIATREANGGIMQLDDVMRYLKRVRSKTNGQEITVEDVKRAIDALRPLGNGLRLVNVGEKQMLVSVPQELSPDHTEVLDLAQESSGCVTASMLKKKKKWSDDRAEQALSTLESQGMAWIDDQMPDGERTWWFPSIALDLIN